MTKEDHRIHIVQSAIKRISCGEREYCYIEGEIYRKPYPISPTSGDKHDFRTCSNCMKLHKEIQNALETHNDVFPNCCESHRKLLKLNVFSINDFKDSHIQCADKIIYCYNHILNNQHKIDWERIIDDYINDVVYSFGCMPKGYGGALFLRAFYQYMIKIVTNGNEYIKEEVKIHVCDFLNNLILPKNQFDPIESLLRIYNNWLNLFPFDFPEFNHIKKDFANRTPLVFLHAGIDSKGHIQYKLPSNKELISWLNEQTQELLKTVKLDTVCSSLLDNYQNTVETKRLDIEEYRILNAYSEGEDLYIETLARWLDVQKQRIELMLSRFPHIDGCEAENSFLEARRRIEGFKQWIESQDGYNILAKIGDAKEKDLQTLFQGLCTIQNGSYRIERETNNGRGPTDFVVSKGSNDTTIVEFKLATSSSLKNNLKYQVEAYKKANRTSNAIVVIFYFTLEEKERVESLLNELKGVINCHPILVDCRNNKPSASRIKKASEL